MACFALDSLSVLCGKRSERSFPLKRKREIKQIIRAKKKKKNRFLSSLPVQHARFGVFNFKALLVASTIGQIGSRAVESARKPVREIDTVNRQKNTHIWKLRALHLIPWECLSANQAGVPSEWDEKEIRNRAKSSREKKGIPVLSSLPEKHASCRVFRSKAMLVGGTLA